jgi:hypothetical protein
MRPKHGVPSSVPQPRRTSFDHLAALQRTAGNRATSSLLGTIGRTRAQPSNDVLAKPAGAGATVRRAPKPPAYDECAATGVPHINSKIENGRQRAIDFVQVAIRALKGDPQARSADAAYRTALKRHFSSAGADQRATIRSNFEKLLGILKSASRIKCASTEDEIAHCATKSGLFGFVMRGGDTITVCPNIVDEPIRCRAIGLIHEAAHILGIGAGATHPPYRGTDQYPWPGIGAKAPAEQTASVRIDNPEAYAYFAAHVWREADTSCPPAPQLEQVIIIEDTAPAP